MRLVSSLAMTMEEDVKGLVALSFNNIFLIKCRNFVQNFVLIQFSKKKTLKIVAQSKVK